MKLSNHECDVVLASFYSLKTGFKKLEQLSVKEETKKRPGRNFANNIVVADEWRENCPVSKGDSMNFFQGQTFSAEAIYNYEILNEC